MSFPIGQLPEAALQSIFSALKPKDALALSLVQKSLREQFFNTLNLLGARLSHSKSSLYALFLVKYGVTESEMEKMCQMLRAGGIECLSGKGALRFLVLKKLSAKSLSSIACNFRQEFSYEAPGIEQRRVWRQILCKLCRFDLLACLADPRGHYKPCYNELEATKIMPVCELLYEIYQQKDLTAGVEEKRVINLIENADTAQLDHNFLGRTMLHRAVMLNRVVEVVALLKKGVCVNKKNATGHTPLFDAVLSASKWQLEQESAAHFSKEANFAAKKEIITHLVAYGATFYTRDNFGDTPLCFAARKGDLELVSLLLDLGADINFKTKEGFSPLNLARRHSHDHLIPFLSQQQAPKTQKKLKEIFGQAILHNI